MKIKRFVGKEISSTLREVREELGPDAVILSNKEIVGGIEILAAVDYDAALYKELEHPAVQQQTPEQTDSLDTNTSSHNQQPVHHAYVETSAEIKKPAGNSVQVEWLQEPTINEMRNELESLRGFMEERFTDLAWDEQTRRHPQRTRLIEELQTLGLSTGISRDISMQLKEHKDFNMMWRNALSKLSNRLPIFEEDLLDDGGIIAFLGSTGVGKTTSLAKIAARFALRHGRQHIALVSTDNFRIGAHEQIRIYGRILDIPVHIASNSKELKEILCSLQDKRLVLIDTAGMSQRDLRLSEQFSVIHDGSPLIRSVLVLSANSQLSALDETVRAFSKAEPEACIITKTDECSSLGPVLSVIDKHKLPAAYVTDGQRVPEDIKQARAGNLVKEALELKKQETERQSQKVHVESHEGYSPYVHG